MSIKEAIVTRVMEAGGRLRVRSALNPILWLCGIITVPCLFVLGWTQQATSWLVGLAVAPVIAAILGFFYLLIVDRDKLQSENFQIRKMELEMIEQKGIPPVEAAGIEVIPDPEAPLLLPGDLDSDTE